MFTALRSKWAQEYSCTPVCDSKHSPCKSWLHQKLHMLGTAQSSSPINNATAYAHVPHVLQFRDQLIVNLKQQ